MSTILHIVSTLALVGGTSAKVYTLALNSRHKNIIFYPGDEKDSPYKAAWQVLSNCILVPGLKKKNYIKNAFTAKKIIKKHDVEIIHAYFTPGVIVCSILTYMCPNLRFVRSFEGNVSQSFIKRKIISLCMNKINYSIFISKYVQAFYLDKIPAKFKKSSEIIYNSASKITDDKDLCHDMTKGQLLSVSGLNNSKNLSIIIEAVALLIKENINVQLEILGEGPLRAKLQNNINNLHINNYVHLLGYRDDVTDKLKKCSIYLHPAKNEGFGIAVLEAMECKCPVIVSDAGALPEIITSGYDGLIASVYSPEDWKNKILWMMKHPLQSSEMGEKAYMTATNKFSISKYVEKTDNVYDRLLKNRY